MESVLFRYKNSCKAGLWEMGNGNFHVDRSFRIDCVGEVKAPTYPIFPKKDIQKIYLNCEEYNHYDNGQMPI